MIPVYAIMAGAAMAFAAAVLCCLVGLVGMHGLAWRGGVEDGRLTIVTVFSAISRGALPPLYYERPSAQTVGEFRAALEQRRSGPSTGLPGHPFRWLLSSNDQFVQEAAAWFEVHAPTARGSGRVGQL